jgi:hypothetical protein
MSLWWVNFVVEEKKEQKLYLLYVDLRKANVGC